MRILHYALGFFPYRTGGLTKYCMDLMEAQKRSGHEVMLLWPGRMSYKPKTPAVKIKKRKYGIISCELLHPLPVALDEGIRDIEAYMEKADREGYLEFLQKINPDIVHFHTFMGIHKEFLETARSLSICMVYTTHDYYGLCFKTTFFSGTDSCNGDCSGCWSCNSTALSLKKIILLQSKPYRCIKNLKLVKYLRKKHRDQFFSGSKEKELDVSQGSIKSGNGYQELRSYYVCMFQMMNMIHFNSSVSEKRYLKYISPEHSCMIHISNKEIADHKKYKEFSSHCVRISFLGALNPAKGYDLLQETLRRLYMNGHKNFILQVYNGTGEINEFTKSYERYTYKQLENIMENTDVLLVPSIWYETFSMIVLEALSYGVPVVASNRVGAKDLLEDGKTGYICEPTLRDLMVAIKKILDNPEEVLGTMNRYIVENTNIMDFETHLQEIWKMYGIGLSKLI